MKQPVIIEEIMGVIVQRVSANLEKDVRYMFGPSTEIEETLIEMTKAQGFTEQLIKKYPLVILFTDFPETYGTENYFGKVTIPSIAIACMTSNTLKAEQRLEQNFKPVLIPIFEELKKQIARHSSFVVGAPENLKMKKWNRYFWGKQKFGTRLNDFVDAIEIQNLEITLNNPKCQQ